MVKAKEILGSLSNVNESKELSRLKSLIDQAEEAQKNDNKEAYNYFMKAIANHENTTEMSKYIEKAKKSMKK